ncbi:MAG TPA: aldo/keto reductase [Myxococcales bacterium]|nr:aldo/keto reductase [Myxococcales bacterium]
MDRYLDPRSEGSPPALVVGTMNFGKRTPEPEAHRIVQRALERGLTFFDTANVYVDGESERILGRALGKRRPEARIATKVGIGGKSDSEGLAPERVTAALEESLRRLGTDRVELYYFHKPDHSRPHEPSLRAMEKLINSGKVGAFGASNYASWQLLEMIQAGLKPRVSQQIYNLLVRQLEIEYFRFARKYGVHTTVYNPLGGGLLAGKVKRDAPPETGSRFDRNPMYQRRYLSDRFFDLADAFARLAAEAERGPVELAYQWVAARPGVDSILLGPASVEQLDAAIEAVARPLAKEVVDRADELHRAFQGTDASYAR